MRQGQILGTGPIFNITIPGLYTLIVTDTDNNCIAQDDVLVEQDLTDPLPELYLLPDYK